MRNNSGEILRAIAAGETIQVTNNGKVAAIISPPPEPEERVIDRLIAEGRARPALEPLSTLTPPPPRRSTVTTKEILDDLRGDR